MKSFNLSSQLYEQIFSKCLAMAKYAFSSGQQVDEAIVKFLGNLGARRSCSQKGSSALGKDLPLSEGQNKTDAQQTLQTPQESDIGQLAVVHWRLS